MWALIEDDHIIIIIEYQSLLHSMSGNTFLSMSGIRVGLIRRIGRCVFVRLVQRRLIAAGYHWRRLNRCPRLTTDHRHHQRKLAHRHQPGTMCAGRIWYLLMGARSAHRTVMAMPEWFVMLLKGYWIVACINQEIRVVEVDSGLISKYHRRPVPMVPVLVMVFQYISQVTTIKTQSVASVLQSWETSSHYQTSLDRANNDMASNLPDQLHHDSRQALREIGSSSWYEEGPVIHR